MLITSNTIKAKKNNKNKSMMFTYKCIDMENYYINQNKLESR